jgi:hypothetical protein
MLGCSLILLRGMPAFHSSMAELLSASENGLTPFGMLAVHWDPSEKVLLFYSSTKQNFFILTQ